MRFTPYAVLLSLLALVSGCKVGGSNGLERRTLTGIKHHITVGGKSLKNPVTFTPEHMADGKEAFGHYCVACHGLDGQNTGVPFADHMSPPLPSLASAEVQEYTDGQLKWIIDYGISPSGMPSSKDTLSDDEIWSIVLYIRHLPPAGSLGEPEFYSH
jgi:cytochrome c553